MRRSDLDEAYYIGLYVESWADFRYVVREYLRGRSARRG